MSMKGHIAAAQEEVHALVLNVMAVSQSSSGVLHHLKALGAPQLLRIKPSIVLLKMFKKKHKVKPASALRNSECRKFRAEVTQIFNLEQPTVEPVADGEAPLSIGAELVPEGLHTSKFTTSTGDVNGVVYLDPATGDPLWLSIGKNTKQLLIPTVYTLWKRRFLVSLSTPGPAIERIQDGADLMIPGVISITSNDSSSLPPLPVDSLVAITKHGSSVPLAVGQLLLPLEELVKALGSEEETKGKAVRVLHYFKDHLWDSGSKQDPPASVPGIPQASPETTERDASAAAAETAEDAAPTDADLASKLEGELTLDEPPKEEVADLSPEDVDQNLRLALLQTIAHTLPQHTEPLPCLASTFLTLYLQPSRPFGSPSLDLKKSSFKNLTKFIKSVEKDGLVKAKEVKGVLTIMSVEPTHPEVLAHKPIRTVGEAEAKEKQKAERRKAEDAKPVVLDVKELWKPSGTVVALFDDGFQVNSGGLYTSTEVSSLLNTYVKDKNLAHPTEKPFVVTDDLLKNVLRKRGEDPVEFIRRDDLVQRIREAMQPWHSIGDGHPARKGALKPVNVAIKIRGGHKAVTIITGFEEYRIPASFLTDELKRICASSTTSGLIQGQAKGGQAEEVLVQGKHLAAVRDLLIAQGIPKRLIQEEDKTGGKKKR
ncbi:hypothetical protein FS837_007787 [Tulasnella sp. UAMH 9824]|nr:hypothetical protein FS837_007787 [Tulasnella sp. UAMH 9824]